MLGWRMLLALWYVNPSGLPIGWILLMMSFIVFIRDAASRSSVDDFWSLWSKSAEAGLLHAYTLGLEVLLLLAALPFLVGGLFTYSS